MGRRLEDSVVIIAGASSGIGQALAHTLSSAGAKLVLAARRLDRLNALNAALGDRHLVVQTDVSHPDQCSRLVQQTIARFGRIDTLVCNAGYGIARPLARTSEPEMTRIFQTNVFGTMDCIRAATPVMQAQPPRDGYRGQIMVVSSAAARRGLPYFGAYSATKAAQLSLVESLRVELREQRIAVTSVHPIGTDTDFFTTAQTLGHTIMPPKSAWEIHQSPRRVAQSMRRAIIHPHPEVWPFPPVRYGLAIATLLPRLVDWIMSFHRRELAKANGE